MTLESFKKIFFPLSVFVFFILICVFIFTPSDASASSFDVKLQVFVCNNNSICEAVIGENYGSCPMDCAAPTSTPTTTPTTTPPTNPPGGSSGAAPLTYSSGNGNSGNASNNQGTGSSTISNEIVGPIVVAPLTDSATISWKTKLASIMTFSWGKSAQYEIGSIAESWYHNDFKVTLDKLDPGVTYYYTFTIKDTLGVEKTFEGAFVTLPIDDSIAIPVDSFKATINYQGIVFDWKNPSSASFSYVRLVRSTEGYPKDPLNGKVVYEGRGSYARDQKLENKKGYYYALFAFDNQGNYSSPAILYIDYDQSKYVKKGNGLEGYDPLIKDEEPFVETIYPLSNDPYQLCGSMSKIMQGQFPSNASNTNIFSSEDMIYLQNGRKIDSNGENDKENKNNIGINANEPIIIKIKATKLPYDQKSTIAFCLSGGVENVKKAYLFSYNPKAGNYEVILPGFTQTIAYKFYVGMVKYGQEERILTRGEFNLQKENSTEKQSGNTKKIIQIILNVIRDERFIFAFGFLILLIVYRLVRRMFKT